MTQNRSGPRVSKKELNNPHSLIHMVNKSLMIMRERDDDKEVLKDSTNYLHDPNACGEMRRLRCIYFMYLQKVIKEDKKEVVLGFLSLTMD